MNEDLFMPDLTDAQRAAFLAGAEREGVIVEATPLMAIAAARAEGWAAAVKALRYGADVLALAGRPVEAKDYGAAADYLEALAEEGRRDGD